MAGEQTVPSRLSISTETLARPQKGPSDIVMILNGADLHHMISEGKIVTAKYYNYFLDNHLLPAVQ
jgi:hypothetical protein